MVIIIITRHGGQIWKREQYMYYQSMGFGDELVQVCKVGINKSYIIMNIITVAGAL